MFLRTSLFAVALITVATAGHAALTFKDMGFRYTGGKCVNAKGEEGLNPSYLGQCADLRGVVASRLDLAGIDFSGSKFDNSDLQSTKFTGSIFTSVSFEGANLSGVDFIEAKFNTVSFQKAVLVNVKLASAEFRNVNLSGTDLSKTDLSYSDFQNASFKGSTLDQAILENGTFMGCDFTDALLRKANLKNANLVNAILNKANLTDANLVKADLTGVKAEGANFTVANMTEAKLKGLIAPGGTFYGTVFKKADLDGADLGTTNLRGANLEDIKMAGTNFKDSKFNRKTTLPFSADRAKELGMLFQKLTTILVWTNMTDKERELPNTMKGITEALTDIEFEYYDGVDVTVVTEKLKTFNVLLIPEQERGFAAAFATGVASTLQAFVKGGGFVIAAADYQGFMKTTGLINRTCGSGSYENNATEVAVKVAAHPLAKDLGAKVLIANATYFCPVVAGEGDDVIMQNNRAYMIDKAMGKGHAIWIGYDYYDVNADTAKVIRNAIQMADM